MVTSKPNNSTSYNPFLFRLVMLAFMLFCMLGRSHGQIPFKDPIFYPSNSWHQGNMDVQSVDMDGDGDLDLVYPDDEIVDFNTFDAGPVVRIKINDGTGSFGPSGGLEALKAGIQIILPFAPNGDLDVGDLNNDGLPDIVVASASQSVPFTVVLNTSSGGNMSFGTPATYGSAKFMGVSIADVNGDGNNDLIFSKMDSGAELSVYYGDGSGGNWSSVLDIDASRPLVYNIVADFNGDGVLDILASIVAVGDREVSFFEGSVLPGGGPAGTFEAEVTYEYFPASIPAYIHKLRVGDMNEDGLPDFIATYMELSEGYFRVGVWLNDGDGTSYTQTEDLADSQGGSTGLAINDMNGDGHLDVVVPDYSGFVYVYEGNGTGMNFIREQFFFRSNGGQAGSPPFTDPPFYTAGTTGDYDNDGIMDMVGMDYGTYLFFGNNKADLEVNQSTTNIGDNGTYDFGYVPEGTASYATDFTINNTGVLDANLGGIQLSGDQASMFSLDQSGTSSVVTAGGSTTFTVTYSPTSSPETTNTAVLSIPSNDPLTPFTINLLAPTIAVLPPSSDCGTALDFDGSNDYIGFGNVANIASRIVTLEAWVNTDALGIRQTIVGKRLVLGGYRYLLELRADGAIEFSFTNNRIISDFELQPNQWYHVAVSYDESTFRIYVDGIERQREEKPVTIESTEEKLQIGGFAGNDFNGKIDNVRIWNIARSGDQIDANKSVELTGGESGLIGYLDFDEGVGNSTVVDKSGSGYIGTLTNMDPAVDWVSADGSIDDDAITIAASACPEYVSPSGNFTWTSSGTYNDMLITPQGCDSLVTVNLTIEPQPQLITFDALADATYGDSDITLSATSDAGLPVSYASSDPNVATISGSILTIVGAGTATITASQAGGACSILAPNVLQSVTVNKVELTATPNGTKTYGGVNPAFTFSYSGFVNGDDASVIDTPPTASTTADETSDVANYPITGAGGLDDNYNLVFVGGTLTVGKLGIAALIIDRTQVYGGVGSPTGYTYGVFGTSFVNGDDESDLDGAQVQTTLVDVNSQVGSYSIVAVNSVVDNNYDVFVIGTGTYTVTPAPLTVTADDLTKLVDDPNPPLTFSYSAFANGEDESVLTSLPTISTTAITSSPAGTYPIALTGGGADNYDLTLVDATMTVSAGIPLTVTADPQTKNYGNSDPSITYQITSGALMGGDMIAGNLSRVVGEDAGTYAIEIGTLTAGPGYVITLISDDLTIAPKTLTITTDASQTKVYGAGDPVLTYTITSGVLESGDALTGSLDRAAGEDVGNHAIVQGSLTAGINYSITFNDADFTITAKPLTISADANQTKIYGEADPLFTHSISSGALEVGDLLTGVLDRLVGENVGSYAIGQGTLSAGGNYNLTYLDDDLSITPKALIVTADASQTKIYGATDPVFSHSITIGSLESGDSFTGALSRIPGADTGNYAIGQGTLDAGANYNLTFVSNDFSIGQKPMTVTADFGQTKTYGAIDPVFTYSTAAGALEAGDFFMGSLIRDIGESAGDYAITIGTLSAGGNYNVTFIPNDFGITAKPITITVDANQSKVYGQVDLALTYAVTSGALETGDNFTGALDRVAGEEVGNYAIGQGNLTTGSNYSLTFNGTNFGITAKPLSITVDANQSKVYGGADLAFTYEQTGTLESGDLLTGVLARASGEEVGNYAINQGNLTAGSNYSITFNDSGFGITERSISITAVAATKQFGDADPALGYQITNGSLVSGDTFTGFLDRTSGEDVGNYTINPGSLTAGTNYSITFNDSDFGITSKPLTITVDANQNKVYGQADPVLTHAITSGSLESGDLLTGASARASGEDVGNYAINQGNLTAGGNYSISFNEADFGITAKPLIVAVDANQSKVYGQTDPVLTHAITSGSLETGDVFTGLLARTSGEVVGTYTINQGSLTAGSNYSIAFNEADFGITGMPLTITTDTDQRKVYGDLDPALTYAVTSGALESGDALTGTLDRTSGENVGNYAIGQGSLSAGGNYTLSFVPNDFDITELSITITADAATKQFADPDPALSYQITSGSLVSGDLFTGSLTRVAGEVVGMYPIQPGTVDVGSNYAVTYIPDNLAITQADQTITFGSLADVKLSDAPFNLSATASSSLGVTYASSDQSVATVSGNMITMVGTGSTTITASQGGDASYNAAPDVVQSLTVNMGDQTITFSPLTDVTIGDPTFNLTGSASSGRSLSYVSSDPAVATVSGSTVTIVAIGTTTITASQAGDSDWNAAIDGTQSLTVNSKLSQTITFSALAAVTYGDADVSLSATGGASGNPVTFVSSNTAVATVSGSTVTILSAGTTNITASQAGDSSFNPAIGVVQGLTVDQRSISVVATSGQSKVYGVPEPLFAYSVSSGSLVSGDVFTGALDRAVGEDVGTYAIGQGNLTAGANYLIAFSGDNFGITAKALTVSADANQDKVYGQTDPTFTQSITSGSLETGDVLSGVLDRVAGENVGTYTINQGSLTAGGNYTITFNNVDFGITTKPLTITADANQSKVYGQVEPVFSYTQTGTLESGDALTGTLDRASGEDVGNYAIGLGSLTAGSNYSLTFGDADFAISSAALMATADDQTRDYNVANPPLTITYAGFVNGENTSSIVEPTIATTATLSSNAGTYPITLSGGSALNYAITSNDGTLTIAPIAQTITFNALNDVSIGSADFNLSATATSGLTVIYTSDNLSVATVSGNTVTIVGMGAANITASQSGDMNHNAAPDVSQSLTVNSKLSQTISFTSLADMTYGDVDFTLAATGGGSGNAIAYTSSDPTVATVSGSSVTILKIGTTMITASQAGDATHNPATDVTQNLTVDQRAITVTADVQSKTYGDVDITLTYSVTSGTLASGDAITGNLSREVGEDVGTYEIQNSSLDAGSNYQLTYIAANLDITTRGLTLTADAQSKTYGDADPVLTYVLTSGALASGDALSGSLTRAVGEDAGAYAINQGTLSAGSNYAITFVSADLTIAGIALEITSAAKSKTYGDADPALTYMLTSGALENGDVLTGALTRTVGEDVGTYTINQGTVSAGSNYAITFVSGDLTITGRALEITADAQNKTYGDADPTLTYTVTNGGIQNGDLFTGSLTRVAGEDVGAYAIDIGTLSAGGNYDMTFIAVDLTITARALTVSANASGKSYGDADPVLTYLVTSGALQVGDALTGELVRVGGEDVGIYAIQQGTLNASANYLLSFVSADYTISARTLEVTADAKSKTYGEVDPVLTYTVANGGIQSGDALSGVLTRAAGEDVGTYSIDEGTLGAGGNYAITFVSADLTITASTLEITADAKSKTYGDTDPALTYAITTGALESGDQLSGALTRAAGKNVGTYGLNQGTLSGGSNYTITFVPADLTITQALLTVTVQDETSVYNTENPTFTLSYGGFIGGELEAGLDIIPTASTTAMEGSDVGDYAITISGGSDNNYAFTYEDGTLTITKATASIQLSDLEQEADGLEKLPTVMTNPEDLNFTVTYDGGVNPTEDGSYAFTVSIDETNYQGSITSTLVLTRILGIDERYLKVYPNPFSSYIRIESREVLKVTIYDLNGKRVMVTESNKDADVSKLGDGMYVVKLEDKQGNISMKRLLKKTN